MVSLRWCSTSSTGCDNICTQQLCGRKHPQSPAACYSSCSAPRSTLPPCCRNAPPASRTAATASVEGDNTAQPAHRRALSSHNVRLVDTQKYFALWWAQATSKFVEVEQRGLCNVRMFDTTFNLREASRLLLKIDCCQRVVYHRFSLACELQKHRGEPIVSQTVTST